MNVEMVVLNCQKRNQCSVTRSPIGCFGAAGNVNGIQCDLEPRFIISGALLNRTIAN